MDRGNVLSGAAFSAVLMSALVFLVVLITVGVVTHGYVERSMSEELRDDVRTRRRAIPQAVIPGLRVTEGPGTHEH